MKTSLVQIQTADDLLLPALLFEPEAAAKKALIFLHGNGSSSILRDQELTSALADALSEAGIAYLALSNRGAGYMDKVDLAHSPGGEDSRRYGMAYELIEECALDIDAAVSFLRDRGHPDVSLLGFSTGANKICVYDRLRPGNPVSRYVLACGGDDSGIYYNEWGDEKFRRLLGEAKAAVTEGRGLEIVTELVRSDDLFVSWRSLLDICDPDGPYNTFPYYEHFSGRLGTKELFAEFSGITKPSLVVYGSEDEYCYGRVPEILELLQSKASPKAAMRFEVIDGADHGLAGKAPELARMVAGFLLK